MDCIVGVAYLMARKRYYDEDRLGFFARMKLLLAARMGRN